ncbi:PAS domain S-box protein [Oceanospirillum sediminis]|uniref:histidine kinase n=1 Tax=Oceanospirillum sediminis TaxID=2760088 RepID=A0A839ITX7_9GAMM|nr:PAS domain-containing sensor histidine kinase [Oceanospirillum sediminis]
MDARLFTRLIAKPYTTLSIVVVVMTLSHLIYPPHLSMYGPMLTGISILTALLLLNQCYLRKQKRKAEQDSQWFNLVLNHVAETVITVDAKGNILYISPAIKQLCGYLPEELKGHSLLQIVPEHLADKHLKGFQKILEQPLPPGQLARVETRVKHKSGYDVDIELSFQETHYQSQRVFVGVLKNIRNQKARQAAEAERQKLALAVHNSPSGVMITDSEGLIEYANPKLLKMTGFDHDEVLGQTPRIFSSGEKSQADYKKMWQSLLSGNSWYDEFRNKRKDGSHYWVVASIAPMYNEFGKLTHFVSVQEDITSIKQANQAMADAKNLAEQALQARSEFLSNMNHELRTPLNAIIGFAQLLESDPDTPLNTEQMEYTEQIISSGRHLLGLINEVLELARIESGRYQLTPVNTNALSVTRESIAMVQHMSEQHNVHMELLIPEQRLPLVYADPGKLKQILLNLLSNAIKYNRPNGKVTVAIHGSGEDKVRIAIQDTGIGIPENLHDQVFQSFNRLHAEEMDIEGTGIGLALSKNLAELMEGSIGFNSTEEQGSTFWVELPLARG